MNGYLANLRPFERRLVVAVATLVFIVANVWFVFPYFSKWRGEQTRMARARSALKVFQEEVGQKPKYDELVRKLEGDALPVPPEEQALQFSRAIQEQEQRSGVHIITTGRQQSRTNQFFLELSEPISVQSGEQQLVDFLYNLGSGNSLIRVRGLVVRPDIPARQSLNSSVTLVATYQKNPPPRAAATAAGKPAAAPATRPTTPTPGKSAISTNRPGPAVKPVTPTPKKP